MADSVEVKVGEDKVHGSLATLIVKPAAGVSRKAIEDKVDELLGRYTIRYRLEIAS
jgi:fatty-acyl-CoA synthase